MRVFSNTAISLDGRIAWNSPQAKMLGSKFDHQKMSELRALADAILIGGNTFRDWPLPMIPSPEHNKENKKHWNVVLTHDLNIDVPQSFLDHPQTQVLFLAPEQTLPKKFSAEVVFCKNEITPEWILAELKKREIQTLLIEAGGNVLGQFLKSKCLHELYVTLCPMLIGQMSAPKFLNHDLVSGDFPQPLELLSQQVVGSEIFLHYKVL